VIAIKRADPREAVFRGFLQASDDYAAALYPAESNHMLDINTLLQPDIYFVGVWRDDVCGGCGAFRQYTDYIEIKRVWVDPEARGYGLSKQLMIHLEAEAMSRGMCLARLETGVSQPEALGLYRALGYQECPPFGAYQVDPLSVFMEKQLSGGMADAL
jgi:putative acetyltransferase